MEKALSQTSEVKIKTVSNTKHPFTVCLATVCQTGDMVIIVYCKSRREKG
jgi:hypothetical protein